MRTFEQVVQSVGHEDKPGHADKFTRDTEAKERLVGHDIVGRRRSVTMDNQLARHVAHSEESKY